MDSVRIAPVCGAERLKTLTERMSTDVTIILGETDTLQKSSDMSWHNQFVRRARAGHVLAGHGLALARGLVGS